MSDRTAWRRRALDHLRAEIAGRVSPERRLAHALALHRWQRRAIPALEAFCAGAEPTRWEDIPAVPVDLFRDVVFSVDPKVPFRTSGTTAGRRGIHWLPDTEAYDLAATAWFRRSVPGAPTDRTLALVPDAADSSLGHMVRTLAPGARWAFSNREGVDLDAAWAALREARGPVLVFAVAFALADLLEAPGGSVRLPAGSVLVVTGGFKGRRRALEPERLDALVRERLGPDLRRVDEYGMTELSSQLWHDGVAYRPPPWLVPYTVDPVSGAPDPAGGLLRFVDLANWGTCLAIETRDVGVVRDGRVHLEGRLADAPPRGCSLAAEDAGEPK